MTNPQENAGEQRTWRFYIDDFSEHYEITNTDRARAEIGDGDLFRMGDKDDARRLLSCLNALEADLATARGLVESGVAAIVNSRPLLTVEEGDWVKAALAYLESHSGGGGV